MKQWETMPLTPWEEDKVEKMVSNGYSTEAAMKTRYALRRKKKLLQVNPQKSTTIQA